MPAKSPAINKKMGMHLRELGQRLRDRRKELKVSSVVAAEAAEVSRITLYRIEKGEASVAMGAYLNVIFALGLALDLKDLTTQKMSADEAKSQLPKKIRISSYKQLKRIAWQLKASTELTPQEALDLYERNWRHLDLSAMTPRERNLLNLLLVSLGREKLLV